MSKKLAICNWGSMKGKTFQIVEMLKNGNYSCKLVGDTSDKYYEYAPNQLEIIE